MVLNFPAPPQADGTEWTDPSNGVKYVYDSAKGSWTASVAGARVPITSGGTEPSNPVVGDLWVDTSECPPEMFVYTTCDDPTGEWVSIGSGGAREVNPDASDISISPSVPGTGTAADPFVLTAVEDNFGDSVSSAETITIGDQRKGDHIIWHDLDVAQNGIRFTQPMGLIGDDGSWSGEILFSDVPASTSRTTYVASLRIGDSDVYFSWDVTMIPNGVINTPTIEAPGHNSGTGNTIYLKSDTISSVAPGGVTLCETDPISAITPISALNKDDWSNKAHQCAQNLTNLSSTGPSEWDILFDGSTSAYGILRFGDTPIADTAYIADSVTIYGNAKESVGITHWIVYTDSNGDTHEVPHLVTASDSWDIKFDVGYAGNVTNLYYKFGGSVYIGAVEIDGRLLVNNSVATDGAVIGSKLEFPSSNGFGCFKPGDKITQGDPTILGKGNYLMTNMSDSRGDYIGDIADPLDDLGVTAITGIYLGYNQATLNAYTAMITEFKIGGVDIQTLNYGNITTYGSRYHAPQFSWENWFNSTPGTVSVQGEPGIGNPYIVRFDNPLPRAILESCYVNLIMYWSLTGDAYTSQSSLSEFGIFDQNNDYHCIFGKTAPSEGVVTAVDDNNPYTISLDGGYWPVGSTLTSRTPYDTKLTLAGTTDIDDDDFIGDVFMTSQTGDGPFFPTNYKLTTTTVSSVVDTPVFDDSQVWSDGKEFAAGEDNDDLFNASYPATFAFRFGVDYASYNFPFGTPGVISTYATYNLTGLKPGGQVKVHITSNDADPNYLAVNDVFCGPTEPTVYGLYDTGQFVKSDGTLKISTLQSSSFNSLGLGAVYINGTKLIDNGTSYVDDGLGLGQNKILTFDGDANTNPDLKYFKEGDVVQVDPFNANYTSMTSGTPYSGQPIKHAYDGDRNTYCSSNGGYITTNFTHPIEVTNDIVLFGHGGGGGNGDLMINGHSYKTKLGSPSATHRTIIITRAELMTDTGSEFFESMSWARNSGSDVWHMQETKVDSKPLIDSSDPPESKVVSVDPANNTMVVDSGDWNVDDTIELSIVAGDGDVLSVDGNVVTLTNVTGRFIADNKAGIDFTIAGPDVLDSPLLTSDVELRSSVFSTNPAGVDNLSNIVWEINGTEQSAGTSNPFKPQGLLTDTKYNVRVKHQGNSLDDSAWSQTTTFTTGSTKNLQSYIATLLARIETLEGN